MNLKWDEDADIFHKTEGLKQITIEDILGFNNVYDSELNAKQQKEKDAADKLERMQKIAQEKAEKVRKVVEEKAKTVVPVPLGGFTIGMVKCFPIINVYITTSYLR